MIRTTTETISRTNQTTVAFKTRLWNTARQKQSVLCVF